VGGWRYSRREHAKVELASQRVAGAEAAEEEEARRRRRGRSESAPAAAGPRVAADPDIYVWPAWCGCTYS